MCASDKAFMRLALAEGKKHLGATAENPSVGCIITNDGEVVGRAVTGIGGRPHAETQALAQAGDQANGATAYVTLEPCAGLLRGQFLRPTNRLEAKDRKSVV